MVLPTQQLVVSMLWERHVLAATISQRNVLNQVLIGIANKTAFSKEYGNTKGWRDAASRPVVAQCCPVALSHCRPHRQGSVAIQGYHNPVGDPAANSPGSGIPPLREETQRQGERRKSAETGGEESIFNP